MSRTIINYADRAAIVENIKCVDQVIPENTWEQKRNDIVHHGVDILAMGADWEGEFDHLKDLCEVTYVPRTPDVSSTRLKQALSGLDPQHLEEMQSAIGLLQSILESYK